jgi:predicted enzyme related to lactoylglutathione lyase
MDPLASPLVVAAALSLLAAVAPAPELPAPATDAPTIADLAFMRGAWEAEMDGNVLEEHFSAPAHGTILGMFRWTSRGATTFTEHIVIEDGADGPTLLLRHFNPGLVPWAQEADGPARFPLSELDGGRAVFADPGRAFPTRIIYHRTRPDTLVARLEGRDDDGGDRHLEITYRSLTMSTTTAATESLTAAGHAMGYDGGLTLSLPVSDLDKSIDFYQGIVGFKLMYKMDEIGWGELTTSVPGVNLGLSQVEQPQPGRQTTPVFGVTDIAKARAALESKGVKFDGETMEIPGMVKLATFFDPDGNPLKLYQTLAETP